MVKTPRKPPIRKADVEARLARAQTDHLLVRVSRWIPKSDRLDGWHLVRRRDIQAISIDPDPDCFEVRALRVRQLWPPSAPDVDLDSTRGAFTSASDATTMVSVFDEFARPDVCWVVSTSAAATRRLCTS